MKLLRRTIMKSTSSWLPQRLHIYPLSQKPRLLTNSQISINSWALTNLEQQTPKTNYYSAAMNNRNGRFGYADQLTLIPTDPQHANFTSYDTH